MKMKSLIMGMAAGLMILGAATVNAATYTSADGVISIEAPSDAWVQTADPNYWFVISDGKNSITVDHLSNGEILPAVTVADENTPAVCQAFVSTRNEVFVVKGLAASEEELSGLMDAIGTMKVLQYNTKTAIAKSQPAPSVSSFGLQAVNDVYYVTADELNVRNACSTDDAAIGVLKRGEKVTVNGIVTKDGADYGWSQIQFNGGVGYVSSQFLSKTAPSTESTAASTKEQKPYPLADGFDVRDAYGNPQGRLVPYSDGNYYSDSMIKYVDNKDGSYTGSAGDVVFDYPLEPANSELVQCEYCGEWLKAGNDYRNHVFAMHTGNSEQSGNDDQELVQCEYCGEWLKAGNDYRNHVFAMHTGNEEQSDYDDNQEMVQCEYCGEWFQAGNDYRNHVMAAHGGN